MEIDQDRARDETTDESHLTIEPPPPSRDALRRWAIPLVEAACARFGVEIVGRGLSARLHAAHEGLIDDLVTRTPIPPEYEPWIAALEVVDSARQLLDRNHPHNWLPVVAFADAAVRAGVGDTLAVVLAGMDWERPELTWGKAKGLSAQVAGSEDTR